MNLKLAELLESVPSEFIQEQDSTLITYQHKSKAIRIRYYDNGQPYFISYWENGKFHRPSTEGPAYQVWRDDGQLVIAEHWENGTKIK